MMSQEALPVRVGVHSGHTRYWVGDYADLTLVVLESDNAQDYRFRCYGCKGHPTYCLHINAVRAYRRQAHMEGE